MKYATLACLGADALSFLQGQLSCDMREVSSNQLTLGCYCNLKGRVIAAPYLYAVPNGFHLIIPADIVPTFIKGLTRVIVFSKATLTDISAEYPTIPVTQNPQFELMHGLGFNLEKGTPASSELWQARLIEAGIPTIGLAQSGQFLPHDLGLVDLGAVSFTKGCYVGQEIIARMQYKGKLKKHLVSMIDPPENHGTVVNEVMFEGKRYVLVISS